MQAIPKLVLVVNQEAHATSIAIGRGNGNGSGCGKGSFRSMLQATPSASPNLTPSPCPSRCLARECIGVRVQSLSFSDTTSLPHPLNQEVAVAIEVGMEEAMGGARDS